MPAGRRPVATTVVRTPAERTQAYERVREEVAAGRQAFVVCAAIDEANRLEVRAAEKEAERLAKDVFPDLRLELLHGRMRPAEKEAVIDRFRAGAADGRVPTTGLQGGGAAPQSPALLRGEARRFRPAPLPPPSGADGPR